MLRTFFIFLLCALAASPLQAAVARLAPDFAFPGAGNRTRSLRSLRGQPVVLVIARSPRTGDFKRQLGKLDGEYNGFATRKAVFIAAFREGEGPVRSDVPFAVCGNGPAVAAAYGVEDDFCVVIIGKDGNVDYQTNRVLPAQRLRDVLQNSFPVQQQERK